MRQTHEAGEKMFVDWAGDKVPIYDRKIVETTPASIFIATLGASNYTFAYATPSQELAQWIDCHVHAFEFYQGTTKLLVPDNLRTGVSRACRYEPDLNRTYHDMALTTSVDARLTLSLDKACIDLRLWSTASPSCRPGRENHGTKPKSKMLWESSNAGFSPPCGTASFSPSAISMKPSRSCSTD